MTEEEWQASIDPSPMLEFRRGKTSQRKLRLFACACCRRIWDQFEGSICPAAIEAAERFADGLCSLKELNSIEEEGWRKHERGALVSWTSAAFAARGILSRRITLTGVPPWVWAAHSQEVEQASQGTLLRELIGNPFRPVVFEPTRLIWRDGLITNLAQAIYNERCLPEGTLDTTRLAILADALEEAGCTDAAILSHLRGPGPHVRGCWALDLILGRE